MFNEDQTDYMAYLATVAPEEKCWCGWSLFGECSNCRTSAPGKTNADKMETLRMKPKLPCMDCGTAHVQTEACPRMKYTTQQLEAYASNPRNTTLERQLAETLLATRGVLSGMLENYLELKRISLAMAKSDAPGWIGSRMTVDDDVHVITARAVLNPRP